MFNKKQTITTILAMAAQHAQAAPLVEADMRKLEDVEAW